MSDRTQAETAGPDPAGLMARAQRVFEAMLRRSQASDTIRIPDPDDIRDSLSKAVAALLQHAPERLVEAQLGWLRCVADLQRYMLARARGEQVAAVIADEPGDRRFADAAWRELLPFDVLRQAYHGLVRQVRTLFADLPGLDRATQRKVDFYLRLYLHAIAPANFPQTNPVVLRHAAESGGRSLLRGFEHLLDDLERGGGRLAIRTTREDLFEVGRDLATTPGKVIYRNDLIELIQYTPTTQQVYRRPLLIVPPWINKYYILDMRPRNSFVRFAVDQGLTVFLISWRNPDAALAHKTFADYMREGPLAALNVVREQTGEKIANILGYCIGGTLTACLLAWLAARGERRIGCATLLTTMTDFAEPGDLGVFIDEAQLARLEAHMAKHGYLDAAYMQTVFALLRDNDLIWHFVIDNYLLGREPPPFDLLYWNADGTRMPAMMHSFYLRKFYLENRLIQPGGIELLGVPLDLGQIRVPCYVLSTREDHIAPWASTYVGARRFGGPVRFVLGGSGHIAGVINPAGSSKYGYWTNRRRPAEPERFLAGATWHEGSWWPDWAAWLTRHSGGPVAPRDPATGPLKPLADAPGRYVLERAT